MADNSNFENANQDQKADEEPSFVVITQYLKDFSFESPNSPDSFFKIGSRPKLDLEVKVDAVQHNEEHYEIILHIACKARDPKSEEPSDIFFITELAYAGIFEIKNMPKDYMERLLFIEAPTILFPFARQILCAATTHGAFPPVLLQCFDFAQLFRERTVQDERVTSH